MFSLEHLHRMLAEFRTLPAETEWLEFKEAKQTFDFDKLGEYFSARLISWEKISKTRALKPLNCFCIEREASRQNCGLF